MRIKITYTEPVPQLNSLTYERLPDKLETFSVVTNNEDEYTMAMAAITNPERGIPPESIVIEELPPGPPTLEEQMQAISAALMEMAGEIYG